MFLHFSNQKRMNHVITVPGNMSYLQVVLIWANSRTKKHLQHYSATWMTEEESRTSVLNKKTWSTSFLIGTGGCHQFWWGTKNLKQVIIPLPLQEGNQATTFHFRYTLPLIACGCEANNVLSLHSRWQCNGQRRICEEHGEKHRGIPTLSHHLLWPFQ